MRDGIRIVSYRIVPWTITRRTSKRPKTYTSEHHINPTLTLLLPFNQPHSYQYTRTQCLTDLVLVQRTITVTVVYIAHRGVARPYGEGLWDARGAEDGEGEDEDHDLRAAVEGAAEEVVVLLEPAGVVLPKPELRDEADDDAGEDGRVRAGGHPVRVHVDDREDDRVDAHTADDGPSLPCERERSVTGRRQMERWN